MRRATLLAATLSLACGSENASEDSQGFSDRTRLSDGSEVVLEGDAVSIEVDGRRVFRTAETALPLARSFGASFTGLLAIWRLVRNDASDLPLTRRTRARREGEAAVIEYEGEPGLSAELRIEPGAAGTSLVTLTFSAPETPSSLALPLACDADASFHGFGEQYGPVDQRGEAFDLLVTEQGIGRDPDKAFVGINGSPHTTYFPMPYYLDARGFGGLLRTDQLVSVDLCRSDPNVAWLEVVAPEPLELVVFHGPKPLDVIAQLGAEVGRPAPPPEWAYDLWIGAQGGRDAVLAEADALEAAEIPAKVLWVQDWTGPRQNVDGGWGVQYRWREDPAHYPDLPGMIATLRQRGYRFLGYANPFVAQNLEHYPELAQADLLLKNADGEIYDQLAPNGASAHADLSLPAARDYVKAHLRRMLVELGMDGWMSDFGEWVPLDAVNAAGDDPVAYHNRYPVEWHRLWREVMDEVRPDGDYVVFARSGWTGVQSVSQIHWAGDQEATFSPHDGLPTVLPALLTLGMSGVPFVTHDIAGFSGGPSTKQLFLRWTELGAFTPIMRTHEGNKKEENWSWESDAETTAHFKRFALIHAALKPDFLELAAEAAQTSAPILRHLMLVFPDDPGSRGVHDQFLIGDRLLVAPVVTEGATSRSVYLPPGTWYHVWSGEPHEGGQTLDVPAPIGAPPVFSNGVDRPDLRAIH